ncbi:DUF5013 domain-containing protein [Chondrinema litorale]|uniref:DUF5013 domain-containing protein n=1 Tax=Chondrinema litorale TaxID=2994555 RepID=UPI002543C97C|nr:DUF5013 domain-containing protein [Chondrinema litorale]UZR98412.1 DUF5013 domain-containing protein [Chondrinema litorale]
MNKIKPILKSIAIGLLIFTMAACDEEVSEFEVFQPPVDVSMRFGGDMLEIPTQRSFSVDSAQTKFEVFLGVSLSTVTLDSFIVDVALANDTANTIVSNGSLENAMLIPESSIQMPSKVQVLANTISAPLHAIIDFNVLAENPDKLLVFAVQLTNAGGNGLANENKTAVIVIDADVAIAASEIGDITAKYLKNTGYPFTSSEREYDGGRWGNLDNWQANDGAKSHNGYGGFNSDAGGTFGLEAGWGSPSILNGKVYQTTTLPAGVYEFAVAEWEWDGTGADPAYFVVNLGSELPDIDNLSDALNYVALSRGVIEFTLSEESEVSLGVVVNFYDSTGQGFKIKKLTLTRIE